MSRSEAEQRGREQIVARCRQLYDRGLIVAADGNVSLRLDEDRILITASGVEKGRMSLEDVLTVDLSGMPVDSASDQVPIQGEIKHRKPSSEFALHRACYEERPDIRAIVHAHPPHAVAQSLVGGEPSNAYLSEVVLALGDVPVLPYCAPTTTKIADQVRPAARAHEAFVLARHGAVTLGCDLAEAMGRMETLEHAAKILWLAQQIGRPTPLSKAEIEELANIKSRLFGN